MAVIDIEYGKEILEGYSQENQLEQNAQVKEWEMILQNSSLAHEYARVELEEATDLLTQEDLSNKLENYKRAYFMARRYLKREDPERLKSIELDLIDRKVRFFGTYNA